MSMFSPLMRLRFYKKQRRQKPTEVLDYTPLYKSMSAAEPVGDEEADLDSQNECRILNETLRTLCNQYCMNRKAMPIETVDSYRIRHSGDGFNWASEYRGLGKSPVRLR